MSYNLNTLSVGERALTYEREAKEYFASRARRFRAGIEKKIKYKEGEARTVKDKVNKDYDRTKHISDRQKVFNTAKSKMDKKGKAIENLRKKFKLVGKKLEVVETDISKLKEQKNLLAKRIKSLKVKSQKAKAVKSEEELLTTRFAKEKMVEEELVSIEFKPKTEEASTLLENKINGGLEGSDSGSSTIANDAPRERLGHQNLADSHNASQSTNGSEQAENPMTPNERWQQVLDELDSAFSSNRLSDILEQQQCSVSYETSSGKVFDIHFEKNALGKYSVKIDAQNRADQTLVMQAREKLVEILKVRNFPLVGIKVRVKN